jgi:hypothetical protein
MLTLIADYQQRSPRPDPAAGCAPCAGCVLMLVLLVGIPVLDAGL